MHFFKNAYLLLNENIEKWKRESSESEATDKMKIDSKPFGTKTVNNQRRS